MACWAPDPGRPSCLSELALRKSASSQPPRASVSPDAFPQERSLSCFFVHLGSENSFFFLKVKITQHIMNCVNIYNSVALRTFTILYNDHLYLVPKHFQHPQRQPHPHEQSLLIPSPAPGNHSTFCLCGFTCSGRFVYTESYNMWAAGSDFFHSGCCLGVLSTFCNMNQLFSVDILDFC